MRFLRQPSVIVITGVMASGKSAVAQLLAEKFERGVHLRGDSFRRMIVKGREEMLPDASHEAEKQLSLRYQLSAATARGYAEAGFHVVWQDVILGPSLQEITQMLNDLPVFVVVLNPSETAISAREQTRDKKGYGVWTIQELNRRLTEETPRIGLWLDTSELSQEETVDEIWKRIWDEGIIRQPQQ
ncbi:AAA family ATPase [Paenibacillus solani]|uniref:Phosphotransferase n=1 Tax=Paenibacillus solani TaxID=1705565 RepID=A0A0M1P5M4_9BACL|nr:AAA family ATPase [Paenibacillus solani]KOR89786.1 phosphotransferase [Paenibacillus solani]